MKVYEKIPKYWKNSIRVYLNLRDLYKIKISKCDNWLFAYTYNGQYDVHLFFQGQPIISGHEKCLHGVNMGIVHKHYNFFTKLKLDIISSSTLVKITKNTLLNSNHHVMIPYSFTTTAIGSVSDTHEENTKNDTYKLPSSTRIDW